MLRENRLDQDMSSSIDVGLIDLNELLETDLKDHHVFKPD